MVEENDILIYNDKKRHVVLSFHFVKFSIPHLFVYELFSNFDFTEFFTPLPHFWGLLSSTSNQS